MNISRVWHNYTDRVKAVMVEVTACLPALLREGVPKKTAALLDFVQMRGGGLGPCPNCLSPFHKCIFGH